MFPVSYNSSTGCTSIPVTSDTELEEDETFTITITSAGTAPYAVVVIPSIVSVTIIDDDRRDEGRKKTLNLFPHSYLLQVKDQ